MYKKFFTFVLIITFALLLTSKVFNQNTFNDKFLSVSSRVKDDQNLRLQELTSKTIYVDSSNTSGIEDGTLAHPYNTIGEGMDAASGGDTVMVFASTYYENIDLKAYVILKGEGPDVTTIWGNVFAWSISNAKIAGFTITDDNTAGLHIRGSSVTVTNNVVMNQPHAGIGCWENSNMIVTNNTVVNCGHAGISQSNSDLFLYNNIIFNNHEGVNVSGSSSLVIDYNNIWGNTYNYSGDVAPGTHDISVNPLFVNSTDDFLLQLESSCRDAGHPDPMYNDVDGSRNDMGAFGGPDGKSYTYKDGPPVVENVQVIPNVLLPGEDITITTYVWDAISMVSSIQAEIESPNETVIATFDLYDDGLHNDGTAGDSIYGNTWSTPADTGSHYFIDIIAVDDSSNSRTYENVAEFDTHEPITVYVDSSNTSGIEDGTLAYPYNTINEAIDVAIMGDTISVARGTYIENIKFNGKNIILKSISGPDSTTIDGNQKDAVVIFDAGEYSTAIIDGFTIRNGKAGSGGGILCIGSSPVISNNQIVDNEAEGNGGGIRCQDGSSPLIFNNIIKDNSCGWDGAGINCENKSNPEIKNNIICYNRGDNNGGGIFTWDYCAPKLFNNLIFENTIRGHGAGINTANNSTATIVNNTIVFNHCQSNHGGIHVPINSAAEIKNNICWFNTGQQIHIDNTSSATVEYCNVQKGFSGTGNIDLNPLFVNPKQQDFHLQLGSSCIDAGDPNLIFNDIDGTRNDMGAYGGPNGSSYQYPDGPPIIEKVGSSGYVNPGEPVTINSYVWDVVSVVSNVKAEIESPDENIHATIELYDDGAHNDNTSGDNIFGNEWTTLSTPMNYLIDIFATDNNANSDTIDNAAFFTTDANTLPQQLTTGSQSDQSQSITQLSDGKIFLVWSQFNSSGSIGNLWYKISDDGGKTWDAPKQLTYSEDWNGNPTIAQSTDGTLWVVWERGFDIWYKTSRDIGITWSSDEQLTESPTMDSYPRMSADSNGKIVVTWTNTSTGNIFYKISLDNGHTWSSSTQLPTGSDWNFTSSVAIDMTGVIHLIWTTNLSGNLDLWYVSSKDNGNTWSTLQQLTSDSYIDIYSNMDIDDVGKMWVTWFSDKAGNYDLYYIIGDGNNIWSSPTQFTRFTGNDFSPDVSIVDNQPWIVWYSDRAVKYDVWGGILGITLDSNPPPHLDWITHDPYSPAPTLDDIITIKAKVTDDASVERVQLIYTIDDVSQNSLTMYDDGIHSDDDAGDDIWGIQIGPYPDGTIIKYQVEAQDISSNIILAPQQSSQAEVIGPFVQTSYLLIVADYKYDYSHWLYYYTDALDAFAYSFDVWDCFLRGEPDSSILNKYDDGAIIWFTPYSGYISESSTQSSLQNYLNSGGKLFITGQNIGAAIHETSFYSDYLHVNFVQDNVGFYSLKGVDSDPIAGGLLVVISGGDGANNQYSPDEIDPIPPAVSMFTYGFSKSSLANQTVMFPKSIKYISNGISEKLYEFFKIENGGFLKKNYLQPSTNSSLSSGSGAIRVDTDIYKVVYFSFGFEAISDAANRALLLNRIMNWLKPKKNAWIHIRGPEKIFPEDTTTYFIDYGGGDSLKVSQKITCVNDLAIVKIQSLTLQGIFPSIFTFVDDDFPFPRTITSGELNETIVSWSLGAELPQIANNTVTLKVENTQDFGSISPIKFVLLDPPITIPIGTGESPQIVIGNPDIDLDAYIKKWSVSPEVRAGEDVINFVRIWNDAARLTSYLQSTVKDILEIPERARIKRLKPRPKSISGGPIRYQIEWLIGQLTEIAGSRLAELVIETFGDAPAGAAISNRASLDFSTSKFPDNNASNNRASTSTIILNSYDPNVMSVTPAGYIKPDQVLDYYIEYENEGNAEAINIRIENELDINLNTSTLAIYDSTYTYNARERKIVWYFPDINLQPDSLGFLIYCIFPFDSLVSGTEIRNKATIFFDYNPGIETPEVLNIIDATKPSSQIDSVSQQNDTDYLVYWSGIDEHSGVKDFTVYVSDNRGDYQPWHTDTTITSAIFTIQPDHIYTLYTIARDSVDNVEDPPDSFDVKIPTQQDVPINIDNIIDLPKEFSLSQNYPNPFNPQTKILYQLPKDTKVVLEIYNILGQKVRTLVNELHKAGYYQLIWDGQNDSGFQVTSGIYLFRLKANGYTSIKKALILR